MKWMIACLVFQSSVCPADEILNRVVEHARKHPDGTALHSFERKAYEREMSRLPIGVFDSGIGGLTVLEAILGLDSFHNDTLKPGADGVPDFAKERFIYFGDQANMPYGNYSKAGRGDFLRELILKDLLFLLGKRYVVDGKQRFDKPPVKAVVIACNTATAYGIEDVRAAISEWGIPVIVVGVVEAGARGVRETGLKDGSGIGVMATAGTCASGAYPRMITRVLGLAGREVPSIVQQGGTHLAGTIEGDPAFKMSVADEAREEVRKLLESYKAGDHAKPLGTVVLGCTHYPLAQRDIESAFDGFRKEETYARWVAPEISFVDPAKWTASELFRELAAAKLRMKPGETCVQKEHAFFMSVPNPSCQGASIHPDGGLEHDYKYGRDPGHLAREDTWNVPMMPDRIPKASQLLLENRLPVVWNSLSSAASLSE